MQLYEPKIHHFSLNFAHRYSYNAFVVIKDGAKIDQIKHIFLVILFSCLEISY